VTDRGARLIAGRNAKRFRIEAITALTKELRKAVELHLRLYKTYEATIANCKRQLDYMLPSAVISYDFNSGGSGFHISTTERSAIDRLESKKAIDLHETIERYTLMIKSINKALECLEPSERAFVEFRYFKQFSLEQIAFEMSYSVRSVFSLKGQALEKLTISLTNIMIAANSSFFGQD
jgi:DNA-directed RNA polymerase specialized sigma subunit